MELYFPNSVPLSAYFYENANYNDIRRSKIMMFGHCLNSYAEFASKSLADKNAMLKGLERGSYRHARKQGAKDIIGSSWDDENFANAYHDICYKLATNLNSEDSSYLTDLILSGEIQPSSAAALTSQEMDPDKYVDVLNKIKLMNEEVKLKTATMYTCTRCKHQETILNQVQDRSNDENSSLIATCTFCGFQWRMAG